MQAVLDLFKLQHDTALEEKDKLIQELKSKNQQLQQQITDLQMSSGVVPKSGRYPLQTQEVYQRQKHKSVHFVLQVILEKNQTPPLKF